MVWQITVELKLSNVTETAPSVCLGHNQIKSNYGQTLLPKVFEAQAYIFGVVRWKYFYTAVPPTPPLQLWIRIYQRIRSCTQKHLGVWNCAPGEGIRWKNPEVKILWDHPCAVWYHYISSRGETLLQPSCGPLPQCFLTLLCCTQIGTFSQKITNILCVGRIELVSCADKGYLPFS